MKYYTFTSIYSNLSQSSRTISMQMWVCAVPLTTRCRGLVYGTFITIPHALSSHRGPKLHPIAVISNKNQISKLAPSPSRALPHTYVLGEGFRQRRSHNGKSIIQSRRNNQNASEWKCTPLSRKSTHEGNVFINVCMYECVGGAKYNNNKKKSKLFVWIYARLLYRWRNSF